MAYPRRLWSWAKTLLLVSNLLMRETSGLPPPPSNWGRGSTLNSPWSLMQREIELLLAKGAIIPITQAPAEQGFISTVFLDPKDGGARPVINLRALNHFISSPHFKMEGMHLLKDLIQSGNWVMRVDLKNAYFKVPIHPTHQRYLRFIWKRSFNSHASRSASVQPHEYSPNSWNQWVVIFGAKE